MKVQDKLELFSKTAISEAEKKSLTVYNKLEADYKNACQKAEESVTLEGEEKVREEEQKARQAYNQAVLAARTESKHSLYIFKSRLTDQLFDEIRNMLESYASDDPGYLSDLSNGIGDVVVKYGVDETTVYLTPRDIPRVPVPKGVTVLESKDELLGGFKAHIAGKGIIVDGLYTSLLEKEKRDFEGIG